MIDVTTGNFPLFLSTLVNTAPRWPAAEFVFNRVGDGSGNRFGSIVVGPRLDESVRRMVRLIADDGSVLSQTTIAEPELVAIVTSLAEDTQNASIPPAASASVVPMQSVSARPAVQLGLF